MRGIIPKPVVTFAHGNMGVQKLYLFFVLKEKAGVKSQDGNMR